jgi:hypothetical protein
MLLVDAVARVELNLETPSVQVIARGGSPYNYFHQSWLRRHRHYLKRGEK